MRTGRWVMSVAVVGMLAGSVDAEPVTLDGNSRYQTIAGFGSYGGKRPYWSGNNPSTYYDAAFVDTVLSSMGETVLRERITPSFAPSAFTAHPVGQINYSVFSTTYLSNEDDEQPFGVKFPYWRALKLRADALGEPLTFVLSVWSPPAWMKDNGSTCNGGHIKPDNYDEFGEMVAAAVKIIKDSTGIDVYAVSIQNEPLFVESYNSCVYTAPTYRDCARAVGGRMRAEGLSTRLFGAEAMASDFMNTRGFTGAILADTSAASVSDVMSVIAVHGYAGDGVTPSSGTAQTWAQLSSHACRYNQGLWMTETSGFSTSWSDCMGVLKGMYVALKHGQLSGWVFWGKDGTIYGSNGIPNKVGHACKNYYRYVRPGAVQIGSDCADTMILVTAFHHPGSATLTIVAINHASTARSIELSGSSLPATFAAYRSSATENCAAIGTVSGSASIALPASSITTLCGAGYNPPVSVAPAVRSEGHRLVPAGVAAFYTIDGRALRAGSWACEGRTVAACALVLGAGQHGRLISRPLAAQQVK